MKTYIIYNPKAGQGNAGATLAKCAKDLGINMYTTKAPHDAYDFVKKTIAENANDELRFIACGGDGTLNEVFSASVGAKNASVTCYPCGSGNDFIKVFGGREKFLDIKKLVNAPAHKIDALKVGKNYSFNVTNFGFDTTVAMTINKERAKTGKGNKNAYTKGVITALLTAMKNKATVVADGETLNPSGKMLLCTLANGQYVGGSFKCAPRAKIDDGLIEVCLIKPISRLRFVKILKPYTAGQHLDDPSMQDIITYRQAKKIEVIAPEGFAYSLDGEIIYENHFTVEIAPAAVNFACPE